jgi:hypothetical protein
MEMWIEGDTQPVSEQYLTDLTELMDWLELDGHQIDFNVVYLDDRADMDVEVYIDEQFAGKAGHWDDILHVVDHYFENDEVYN